jgi:hypothetical protein
MKYTNEDKQALIELIEWYRNEHNKKDFGHSEMIKTIRTTNDDNDIRWIERTIEDWVNH